MGFLDAYHQRRADLAAPGGVTPVYHRQPVAPVQAPPEPLGVPLFCSLYGKFSLILAEQHGGDLRLVRCEVPPSGGGLLRPPAELGRFHRVDAGNWTGCGHCGTAHGLTFGLESVWLCPCQQCNGLFHCCGNQDGLFRKACGDFKRITSTNTCDSFQLQGWRGGSTAHQPAAFRREPPLYRAPPPMPQIAAPSSTLRIGFRGSQT